MGSSSSSPNTSTGTRRDLQKKKTQRDLPKKKTQRDLPKKKTQRETKERSVPFEAKVAVVAVTAGVGLLCVGGVAAAAAALSGSGTDEDNRKTMVASAGPAGSPSERICRDDFQILQYVDREAEKWIQHYSSKQKILLVGEGDLSFSLCLAKAFGSARNMVATSFNSQKDLARMYKEDGMRNVRGLEEKGCLVLYKVDALKMSQDLTLNTQSFDRIVYNFPHAGFHKFPEDDNRQIKLNKTLVEGFFKNAKNLLQKQGGEIHVTHKKGYPYDEWDLVKKAEKIGLVLHAEVPFRREDYPGYHNKRGHGKDCNDPFKIGDCSTYKFRLPPS